MKDKFKSFDLVYLFIFIANIVVLYHWTSYKMVAKPMIVISLMGYYIMQSPKQDVMMLLALVFALFGDIFLMIENDSFFMLGLGSFLIMQVLYTFLFAKNFENNKTTLLLSSVLLLLIASGIFLILYPGLGALKVPVCIYMLAISGMVWTASNRDKDVLGYHLVLFGAIFFMVSDALLALAKFNMAWPGSDAMVMGTYMIAQYAIVKGIVLNNGTGTVKM